MGKKDSPPGKAGDIMGDGHEIIKPDGHEIMRLYSVCSRQGLPRLAEPNLQTYVALQGIEGYRQVLIVEI